MVLLVSILTLLTKTLRSKSREVFLSILCSCNSTSDAILNRNKPTIEFCFH